MKVVKVRVFISGMLLASALVAGSAHADLVEYDWQNEGDGLVSYDTETGAVWLDLTVTQNMSINQMKDALVNDSTFSGWRLPTVAEMKQLGSSLFAIIASTDGMVFAGSNTEEELAAHAIMGQNVGDFTYGIYANGNASVLFGSNASDDVWFEYAWTSDHDFARNYEGVYLIADDTSVSLDGEKMNAVAANVPAPVGVLGLLGAGLFAFRRKID